MGTDTRWLHGDFFICKCDTRWLHGDLFDLDEDETEIRVLDLAAPVE